MSKKNEKLKEEDQHVEVLKDQATGRDIKVLKDHSNGEVMYITNNQRCSWLAPPLLLGTKGYSDKTLVYSMRGIDVDKGLFDFEIKYNKAFKFMVETGLLIASKKVVKVDERDLKNIAPTTPPPMLSKDGGALAERGDVLSEAVTIDVKHSVGKK